MKNLILSILILAVLTVFSCNSLFAEADYFVPSEIGTAANTIGKANIKGFSSLSNSVFDNPAAMYSLSKFSASLFTTKFMDEVVYQNLSIAMRLPVGVLGFGYMSAGVADIPKTAKTIYNGDNNDYSFTQIGSYQYQNKLLKLGYEWSQNKFLHWGISGSYFTTEVDTYTASGMNLDAGLVVDVAPFTASVVIRNIVPGMKVSFKNTNSESGSRQTISSTNAQETNNYNNYGTQTEKLPLETIYGLQYKWEEFKFLGQIRFSDSNRQMNKAAAVSYKPRLIPFVEFSGGYREFPVVNQLKSSLTCGVGLTLNGVNFDYAFETSDHPQFNGKHYFSLGFTF